MLKEQPSGLSILFFTEMWERVGFYIVQGLLVLYMVNGLGFSDSHSYEILGAFTALAYLFTVVGGFIADRFIGFKHAILLGGIFLILGYALLGFGDPHSLYLALGFIIIGSGFFKPNVSSLLGTLYHKDDPRRDAGFTLFYVGINLGGIIATTTGGFIKNFFGWHTPFIVASVGLLFGLGIFLGGLSKIKGNEAEPQHSFLASLIIYGLCVLSVLGAEKLIAASNVINILLPAFGVSLLIGLFIHSFFYDKIQRRRFWVLLILILFSIVFWGIFFQTFFSTNLFIERVVDRTIFGFTLPALFYISLENLFIIILGPLIAKLWIAMIARNKEPSLPTKFALALLLIGIGYLLLVLSTHYLNDHFQVSTIWIIFAYLFVTLGELFLSPIGLAMITTLSPPNIVGMMMGVWFMSLGFGGELAGVIAKLASFPAGKVDPLFAVDLYSQAFLSYAYYALVVGIIILITVPFLKKMLQSK